MVDKGEGCDILNIDYSKAFYIVPCERNELHWIAVCSIRDSKEYSLGVFVPVRDM